MASTLKLEIVTPESTIYSEDVEMVTLPGVVGQMGVYPQHVPLMTQMVPGEIIVRKGGWDQFIASGEGLIEVTADRVSVLTDLAIGAESIDEAKAEEARRQAEARLRENISTEEAAAAHAALARSLAQLQFKRRRRAKA
jgi:F-type H+-transporting ATPase subunit epsilon